MGDTARSAPPAAASGRRTRTRSRGARCACRTCSIRSASRPSSKRCSSCHNFMLTQLLQARRRCRFAATRDETLALAPQITPMVADVAALIQRGARTRRIAAVRRRAGSAARRRPRHVSVRDGVELPRRRRGAGQRHRPADARLRARHRQGLHDARRHGPVSHRADRRHRRAARASAATSSARSPAARAAAAGSTFPRCARSFQLNGVDGLCITKLDVLDGMREIRICTRLHGATASASICMPTGADAVADACRVYETMPGWTREHGRRASFDALPANARAYLRRIEALTGVPIAMVSTGPDRDETILLHHPFH